jgi:hypothetical protein
MCSRVQVCSASICRADENFFVKLDRLPGPRERERQSAKMEKPKIANRKISKIANRQKQKSLKRTLSVDLASINFAERFEFAEKSLVRSCAIAVQRNAVFHRCKQCPYEATTSTRLKALVVRSEHWGHKELQRAKPDRASICRAAGSGGSHSASI